jgi:hypothetical protein
MKKIVAVHEGASWMLLEEIIYPAPPGENSSEFPLLHSLVWLETGSRGVARNKELI